MLIDVTIPVNMPSALRILDLHNFELATWSSLCDFPQKISRSEDTTSMF